MYGDLLVSHSSSLYRCIFIFVKPPHPFFLPLSLPPSLPQVVSTVRELVKVNPLFKEHFNFYTQKIDIVDPFRLADFAATLSTAEGKELQVGNEGGREGGKEGGREAG
jgi:hypothetical protein